MLKIDARGKVCPIPVIETKKALRSADGAKGAVVLVDNLIATQNLSKMAAQMKLASSVTKHSEDEYEVVISPSEASDTKIDSVTENKPIQSSDRYVVAIASDKMGDGDDELGKKLLEGFIYSLTEQDVLPDVVLFYNSGVRMTTENQKSIDDLNRLRNLGTEILSCGLCLNYYHLTEKLGVGEVTNMYRITEILRSNHVVRP